MTPKLQQYIEDLAVQAIACDDPLFIGSAEYNRGYRDGTANLARLILNERGVYSSRDL